MYAINPGTRRPLLTALAACLLFVPVACNRSHTVTTSDGKVTVDVNQGKIPNDYPKDVPVYGGKVGMSQSFSERNARSIMQVLTDKD